MDISFSSMFFHDAQLEDIFRVPGSAGADTLEFWLETPDFWLKGLPMEHLKNCLAIYPIRSPISVHAPVLDLNPCSINPDVRDVSILWVERTIELAEEVGAAVCTIHPGRRTAKRPPSSTDYQRLGHMLDVIEPLAESVKVKVAIENMEPAVNALLSTPDEVNSVLKERPWLWFTFDVAHAIGSGIEGAGSFLHTALDKIANIHISANMNGKMHGPVSWDTQTTGFLREIQKSGYSGLVTLELNDLVLPGRLTYQEKVSLIKEEISWIRSHLQ